MGDAAAVVEDVEDVVEVVLEPEGYVQRTQSAQAASLQYMLAVASGTNPAFAIELFPNLQTMLETSKA